MSHVGGTSLNLLLFSVGGVCFAMDAEQVTGIDPYDEASADGLLWFHELAGFEKETIRYDSPSVVAVKMRGREQFRVIIDMLEDITEFRTDELRLFPPLLEPFALKLGIWGVLLQDVRMVLIVDLHRLLTDFESQ